MSLFQNNQNNLESNFNKNLQNEHPSGSVGIDGDSNEKDDQFEKNKSYLSTNKKI